MRFSTRSGILPLLISSLLGGVLALAISHYVHKPAVALGPPVDARFSAIGSTYLPQLGRQYAAAWEDGANVLDAGQPVSAAIAAVGAAWTAKRTALYDQVITPELGKILPENTKDADVTTEERAALSAAFRGLASGLAQ